MKTITLFGMNSNEVIAYANVKTVDVFGNRTEITLDNGDKIHTTLWYIVTEESQRLWGG